MKGSVFEGIARSATVGGHKGFRGSAHRGVGMTSAATAPFGAAGERVSTSAAPHELARLSPGVVTALTTITVAAAVLAVAFTGHLTWAPVILAAGIAMACGIVDRRTGVIPNGLVLDALAVVVLLVGPVTVFDDRPLAELGGALLAGLALSGAPLLFAVWLVAPRLIGGGDWKLLSVLGLAAGYLAPSLAMVVLLLALVLALVAGALYRRRHVALGPALAVAFVAAIVLGAWRPDLSEAGSRRSHQMTSIREDASAVGNGSAPRAGSPAAELAASRGLRLRPHRPVRALAGAFLVVASVVAAITLYSRLGDRTEVLAVNRTVLAGEQITGADLEIVSISSDDHIAFRPASDRSLVIGQYARVRLAADSLLVDDSLQPQPLVDPDRVLMSVEVPAGQVPVGLREQSRLVLVVTPPGGPSDVAPVLVEAVVAAVPRDLAEVVGAGGDSRATVALSVEVPPADVALVGSAEAVSVGVLDPLGHVPRARPPAAADSTVDAVDHGGAAAMSIVAVCTCAGHRGGDHHGAPARLRWRRPPRPRWWPSATRRAGTSRPGPASPPSRAGRPPLPRRSRRGRSSSGTPRHCRTDRG